MVCLVPARPHACCLPLRFRSFRSGHATYCPQHMLCPSQPRVPTIWSISTAPRPPLTPHPSHLDPPSTSGPLPAAPFIFWGVWRLVSPFVHPATREKLCFASGAAGRQRLLAAVPPDVLPRECGGHADPVPIEVAVAAWRAEVAAAAAAAGDKTAGAAVGRGGVGGQLPHYPLCGGRRRPR